MLTLTDGRCSKPRSFRNSQGLKLQVLLSNPSKVTLSPETTGQVLLAKDDF